MRTPICERLGIEFPIFAFSHCRDVVAAVSKAGGYGVLGALAYSPDQLEIELNWIDDHVDGMPYGVDFAMPAKYVGKGGGAEASLSHLHELIPSEHQTFVEELLAEHGVPPLPDDLQPGVVKAAGLGVDEEGPGQVEVALSHPVSMVVNALGPPPPYVVEQAHERGILVGGLVGNRQHAERQVAQGTDVIVAQGTEAGGHCGDVSTMVLVPEVVDAVGPDVPVLAAGGIGSRAADGRRAGAGRAGGVDRFHLAHGGRSRHEPDCGGEAAGRQLARHRAVTVDDGQAGAPAAHRVDRRLGARRHARSVADAAPGDRVLRGGAPGQPRPEPGPHRVPGRADRREHDLGPAGARRHLRHGRGMGRDHAATRNPRRDGVSSDLERIHEFTSLVIASTRSSRQRERLQRALGLGVSETNLGALRLIERHGPIVVTEMARRLEIDQSNASRQVRALEEQGLVARSVDPDDRRVARLGVTAAGRKVLARVRAVALNDYAVALEDWSATDRAQLAALLDRFRIALLQAETDESGWSVGKAAER